MLDPENRNFFHSKTFFFREKKELGIKHPSGFAAQREKNARGGGRDRLQPTLRVLNGKVKDRELEKAIDPRSDFAMHAP